MVGGMINKSFLDLKKFIRELNRKGALPLRYSGSVKGYKSMYKETP
jgi:hypothetical protein